MPAFLRIWSEMMLKLSLENFYFQIIDEIINHE